MSLNRRYRRYKLVPGKYYKLVLAGTQWPEVPMVLLYELVGPGIVFLDPGERQARRGRMHRACHSTQARIVQVLRVCVPGPSLRVAPSGF